MRKGKIVVENGVVVMVHGEGTPAAVPGQPLWDCLKTLEAAGWVPEGELPPYTTSGRYQIPLVNPD